MPLDIFHVSGLWQNTQRNWQPASQATTRTPGPSTAEPVVNECTKPHSPVSSADLMSGSLTFSPSPTRRSYGLPMSGTAGFSTSVIIAHKTPVECAFEY